MNTDYAQDRIDAENLVTYLLLPIAQRTIPEANVMAAYLKLLLTSCTQEEANEQLRDEIQNVMAIMEMSS